jgi:hypothetical protein
MARGGMPEESHEVNERPWKVLLSAAIEKPMELAPHGHALSEFSLSDAQRRFGAHGTSDSDEHNRSV